eukprot:363272-Chlamydomonas_euryale.AAC.5
MLGKVGGPIRPMPLLVFGLLYGRGVSLALSLFCEAGHLRACIQHSHPGPPGACGILRVACRWLWVPEGGCGCLCVAMGARGCLQHACCTHCPLLRFEFDEAGPFSLVLEGLCECSSFVSRPATLEAGLRLDYGWTIARL